MANMKFKTGVVLEATLHPGKNIRGSSRNGKSKQ